MAVAVITTAPAAPGAEYVVFAPLAVWAAVKLPHEPVGVQVQSTPAFALSLVTVAASVAVPPGSKVVGGAVVMEMAIEPEEAAVIEMFATAVAAWLLVDVAVIVTFTAAAGAVYVVLAPLAVCAGLKVPQDAAGEQLQSTPAFAESLETVAEIVAVPFAASELGGACVMEVEMVPEGCEVTLVLDPTAPHPDKLTARNRRVAPRNISNVHVARTFSTRSLLTL